MYVSRGEHANAKTCDEAECSSHANEGLGKYSDGREQGAVKASLVLMLGSAAGFPRHSGNSGTLLPLSREYLSWTERAEGNCFCEADGTYASY